MKPTPRTRLCDARRTTKPTYAASSKHSEESAKPRERFSAHNAGSRPPGFDQVASASKDTK